jgi:glutamine synthetase
MLLEYLWLDANLHLRSKIRSFHDEIGIDVIRSHFNNGVKYKTCYDTGKQFILSKLPIWNYDGSSTGQGTTEKSDVLLHPVNFIKHPFLDYHDGERYNCKALLVLCSNMISDDKPVVGNSRYQAAIEFNKPENKDKAVWFGLEQEFFFFEKETKKPLGWKGQQQIKQGEYYCGVNRSSHVERTIMNELITIALKVGLSMSGINQEVAPAQWEYQIGPVLGIEAGDQMIFAKYILYMLCERHGLYATFHPKPLSGEWNGSGCHINISTAEIRETFSNDDAIIKVITKIGEDHDNFISNYCGNNNEMRLTGNYETSDPMKFSYGVGSRTSSIRIPIMKGSKNRYFEDRRPGSAIDYYKTLAKYLEYI